MNILITGICGFVGSTLARRLLEMRADLAIVGMDNLIRPGSEIHRETLRSLGIRLVHGDIRSASDFEGLPKLDYVIDAAALPSVLAGVDGQTSSRQLMEHNLHGTINILERCKRDAAGFILFNTSRVYSIPPLTALPLLIDAEAYVPDFDRIAIAGMSRQGLDERFSTNPPLSLYGASKLTSEILALEYGSSFGFPVWSNRCGVLAGGGQLGRPDQGVFSYWIHGWRERRPLRYVGFDGQGHQVRDCLHPRDMAGVLLKQMDCTGNDKRRVQNLSGGMESATSLAQLSRWCEGRLGKHSVAGDSTSRPHDVPWLVLDSSLATAQWGWKPQTPKEDIFEEIARHAEAHPDWLSLSSPGSGAR